MRRDQGLATVFETFQREQPLLLPLLDMDDPERVVVWREGRPIRAVDFAADVAAVAAQLPSGPAAVNLCEGRYAFLVAFCAVASRGQASLLPSSRAPEAIDAVMADVPGSYALGDQTLPVAPPRYHLLPPLTQLHVTGAAAPLIAADQVVAIGYTSGSTGRPTAVPKTWGSFTASNAANRAMLQRVSPGPLNVVATVPSQHMYGMETAVLLPLLGGISLHEGRPFFPADVARALAVMSALRVLVTTPVHLRALVNAGVDLPPLAAMLSATAPMPPELAAAAELRFGAPLIEVFGSTETCVFASRRTTAGPRWTLYPGVRLHPQPDGTLVEAPQLDSPMPLSDIVTLHDEGRAFELRGRHADMLEIAGKRASLAALTQRLLAVPGVTDGVVLQMDEPDATGVRRIAALVVAPGLTEPFILDALRQAMDPVFVPRRLRLVSALPRNDTGKLPRAQLLALLKAPL